MFTTKRLIAVLLLGGAVAGVLVYRNSTAVTTKPTYVTAQPSRGLLIVSLNGAGQVASESRVDIKPKVSGDLLAMKVAPGQLVKKGDVIAEIDKTAALKTVRDAEISLASAKLSLSKLKQPPTTSSLIAAKNAVSAAERNLQNAQATAAANLQQAQDQVDAAVRNTQLSSDGVTPQVVRNVYDNSASVYIAAMQTTANAVHDTDGMDYNPDLYSTLDPTRRATFVSAYQAAIAARDEAIKLTTALAIQNEKIENLDAAKDKVSFAMEKTMVLLGAAADALQTTIASTGLSQSALDQLKSAIQSDRTNVASKQASILSQQQTIIQAKNAYADSGAQLAQAQSTLQRLQQGGADKDVKDAQERLNEATQQLKDLQAGPMSIDVSLSQNTIDSRAATLSDALAALADYTVYAPFDGTIAVAAPLPGDPMGPSTVVATIVGKQQLAQITLNEVDAAKVKVGQKATVAFDAIPDLTISGVVQSIDTLGTVSQGVVSYAVKISFDTQDERVRPGMSVSASIITDSKADALTVPSSAVKAAGAGSYVDVLDTVPADATGPVEGTPRRVTVQTGLANDSQTEITNGLTGTENVVVQTIQPKTGTTATTQNTNALRALTGGGGGGGGGNFRFGGGGAAGGR